MRDTGRTVRVGDADLHFSDFAALEVRVKAEQRALLQIETGPLARDPRDQAAWRDVERHAAALRDLLTALDDWIVADLAELDRDIDAARAALRQIGAQNL